LEGVRQDEHRTSALGYSTIKYKLVVVALSGFLAGVGGGLFSVVNGSINPTLFGLSVSLLAFIWVAIGGQGTIWGPFTAAVVLNVLEAYMSTVNSDLYLVVLALIFVVVVLLLPTGLAGLLVKRFRTSPRRSRRPLSPERAGVSA
jgi:urea transport system permease protein